MKFIITCILALVLVACSSTEESKNRPYAKPGPELVKEHKSKSVIVISVKPNKGRKCWQHAKHWHCRR